MRHFSNYLTAEGPFFLRYLSPVVVFSRGVVYNFLMILPVIIAAAALLSLFYSLPAGKQESLQLHLNTASFNKALKEQKKAQNAYDHFIRVNTLSVNEVDYDDRIRFIRQEAHLTTKEKELFDSVIKTRQVVRNHLWSLVLIPLSGFTIYLILAFATLFCRALPEETNGPLRRLRINTLGSVILLICCIYFAIQLFGAAVTYWNFHNVSNIYALASLAALLDPKLLQGLAFAGGGRGKVIRFAIIIVLLTLAPFILLFVTGFFVNLLMGNAGILLDHFSPLSCLAALALSGLLAYVTRFHMNINLFSLHNFYRDRLCRAYMVQGKKHGASPHNPFGQLRPCGDSKLSSLYDDPATIGPYQIICANINLQKNLEEGKRQRRVIRRGESFIFSKHWCGSKITGYCDTCEYEQLDPHIDLGTAMAVSGAAVNIGMGQETASLFRPLLSLFNLRLGYWAVNPNQLEKTKKKGVLPLPGANTSGSNCALKEWTGRYSPTDPFINLSDGGHFDNIGVYELLRRRCKYIIVADAEADAKMRFKALSYLLRLARIDFGIEIDIDINSLSRSAQGYSRQHAVVGKITYPQTEKCRKEMGYLLYCKSSLSGDEPVHLHEYHAKHPDFPHETTVDQWFDEQQFEVYRELGYHIGKTVLEAAKPFSGRTNMEEIFVRLREYWHPRMPQTLQRYTEHSTELTRIFELMQTTSDLAWMDAQCYPEWPELMHGTRPPEKTAIDLPEEAEKRRAGFYLCNQMIQLMENVYLDLDLENQYAHPDNRGWMNLFTHWSWSYMFRATWAISACTYGAKFQRFCCRRLSLDYGEVVVEQQAQGVHADSFSKTPSVFTKLSLNEYEQRVAQDYLRHHGDLPRDLYVFSITVHSRNHGRTLIKFPIGFAFIRQETKDIALDYFRLQDHLRRVGLGRQAMRKLMLFHDIVPPAGRTRLYLGMPLNPSFTYTFDAATMQHLIDSVTDELSTQQI